jgi:1,4-dihydroxy-2-naphthoate octaprenyltransferase
MIIMRFIGFVFVATVAVHMMIRRSQDRIRAFILHGVLLMAAAFLVGVYAVVLDEWIAFLGLGIVASVSQYVFARHGQS